MAMRTFSAITSLKINMDASLKTISVLLLTISKFLDRLAEDSSELINPTRLLTLSILHWFLALSNGNTSTLADPTFES